jgi:hypothetical protein
MCMRKQTYVHARTCPVNSFIYLFTHGIIIRSITATAIRYDPTNQRTNYPSYLPPRILAEDLDAPSLLMREGTSAVEFDRNEACLAATHRNALLLVVETNLNAMIVVVIVSCQSMKQ